MVGTNNFFLAEHTDLLDKILATSTDHIHVVDRAGRYQYISPAGLAAVGLQADDMLGKTWRELNFPTDIMERHDAQRESVLQTGIPVKDEASFPTVDGIRYYEYILSPIFGDTGTIDAVINTATDITERKQTEDAMRESEMRFHALVDAVFEGIVVQENGKIIEANPGFAKMFGYSLEEVMGRSAADFLTPESVEIVLHNTAIRHETSYEVTGIKKDGTHIDLEVVGKQSFYQGRSVRISAARDITERKQAEIALREKEQQLQQLSDLMPQFIWMSNAQGETEYVNRQWLDYSGLTIEQSRDPQIVAEFLHPEEVQVVSEQWAIAQATKQPFEIEARLKRGADGAYRWFLMRSIPALNEQGQVVRWYGTSTDIHNHKITQLNEQFLNELNLRLRQLSDADAMVREAIRCIGEYLNVERCVWHEIHVQEDLSIVTQDWRRRSDISSVVGVTRLSESILPEMITQFHAGQPAVVSDVATHPYTAPFAQNFAERDIRSFVGVPCLYEGRWVAVLAINARTVQEWQPDQVALLQEVVARLWSLIEQTRAMQALQEQEERTRLATEAAALGMWFWDITENELAWTDRCKTLFGLAPEATVNYEIFLNALHPDDRDSFQATVTHSLAEKIEYDAEYRTVWPDGSIHWIAAKGRGFYDASGRPIRMMGTMQDISDRKRTEAGLRERERLFSTLAEALPVTIFRFDVASHCTYINNYWTTMTGRTVDSVMGLGWLETLHPEDRDRLASAWLGWSQNAQHRSLYQNEGRLVHVNGQDVWYYIQALPEVNDNGETIGYIGVMTDITERKQTEAALQEREALLHLFAQFAPAGIAMFDREMRYVMASQRWAEDYNQGSLESMIGRSIYDLFSELPERWRQVHQRCLAGAIEKCDEDLFVWADGRQQWIRWETHSWYAATDEIGGIIIFAEDITQRKQSEGAILQLNQELQQKVTELQTLLDVIPIGIGIAEDPECQHIRVNPAFADALGIPATVNASLSAPEEDRPTTFKVYQNGQEMAPEALPLQYAATHGVEIRDLEVDVVWQDGTIVTLLEYAAPLLDASGQTRGSVGAFLNITDRKRAEQSLRDREQQLKLALQAAKAGAWTWELATNRLYWSDEYYRVFGLEPGSMEPSYENGFSRLHPDDREWVERETTEAIAQGRNTNVEYRILLPDGTVRWVIGIGQIFYNESNQPANMAGIVVDITERKQIEAELRQREELYRALAHNFPNGAVHIFDHDLRYLLCDGTEMRKVGLSQEQLEGHTIWDVLPPETSATLEPLYRAALVGETTSSELTFADQSYQIYTLPLRNEQGEIFAGLSMSQNVTLLKQAEHTLRTARDELERQVQERTRELREANERLQQREREFRTLVENTPDVITRHDRQYRYLYINPASTNVAGIPPEFYLGKKPSELGYPEEVTKFWELSLESVFTTGEMRVGEFRVTHLNEPKSYQVYVVPEWETDQTITSVMTIARDVTQLRQAEESARKLAEELKRSNQELEQFAYVASHDLQEPLRAITSFTQLLAKRYQGQLDAKADTYIGFIVDGAIRMQQLVRDLLAYSRVGRSELLIQPVDCNTVLERVKKDLQVAIAENRAIITADPLPMVTADPNQLANLLQNLISNSLKYRSEADPRIHISAKAVTVEGNSASSQDSPSSPTMPVQEWMFSLQDNGIGIEPQYAERIFGIFQRLHTSDEYSGTGLGLAICRKIVERHQGRIWVESQLGQGATFFFTIPIILRSQDDNPRQITQDSFS